MKQHSSQIPDSTLLGSSCAYPDVHKRLEYAHRIFLALNTPLMETSMVYFDKSDKVISIPLTSPSTVGRTDRSTIMLDSSLLSSMHFKLELDEYGFWVIEDLGSKNGTLLNGEPLSKKVQLNWGDIIEAGRIAFVLLPGKGSF